MIEDRNVIEQDVETFTDEIPDDALESAGGATFRPFMSNGTCIVDGC
jgi:hypothetical protein